MDGKSVLERVARALSEVRLEVILIGNAAAALQGAPVTTLDLDFMFRKTRGNIRKLKLLADRLGARIYKPFYPLSGLYRLMDEDAGLQLDFMSVVHGVKSFASLRSRASEVVFGRYGLRVAALSDVIRSKKILSRPRDAAVIPILERTLGAKKEHQNKG